MKTIYFAGWHSAVQIDNESIDYYVHWLQRAKEAEASGRILVVFEVPADEMAGHSSSAIQKIEALLQEEYGDGVHTMD